MDRLTNLFLFLFLAITIGLMLLLGQPLSIDWWLQAAGFIAWACVPYALLWVLNNIVIEEEPRRDWVLLTATLAVCMFAVIWLVRSFLGDPGEMELARRLGAVYTMMPVWQSLIAAAGGLIAFLLPGKSS